MQRLTVNSEVWKLVYTMPDELDEVMRELLNPAVNCLGFWVTTSDGEMSFGRRITIIGRNLVCWNDVADHIELGRVALVEQYLC